MYSPFVKIFLRRLPSEGSSAHIQLLQMQTEVFFLETLGPAFRKRRFIIRTSEPPGGSPTHPTRFRSGMICTSEPGGLEVQIGYDMAVLPGGSHGQRATTLVPRRVEEHCTIGPNQITGRQKTFWCFVVLSIYWIIYNYIALYTNIKQYTNIT